MKFLVMLSPVPPPACLRPNWSRTASITKCSTTPCIPGYLWKTGMSEESPAREEEASAIPAEEEESSSSGATRVGVAEPEPGPGDSRPGVVTSLVPGLEKRLWWAVDVGNLRKKLHLDSRRYHWATRSWEMKLLADGSVCWVPIFSDLMVVQDLWGRKKCQSHQGNVWMTTVSSHS